MKRLIAIGLPIALLIVVVAPFIVGDAEHIELDDSVRTAKYPSSAFVTLADGVTHYEWAGPEDGEIVVFVHGFSSPSFIWNEQFGAVADAGFRVLRYDQFGRGLSDRPDVVYDDDLYDRQLQDLLDALAVRQPVNLVGLSMGGATTIRFTDRHPDRVARIVLMAPAGFGANIPAFAQLLRVPGLSHWLLQAFGDRLLRSSVDQMIAENPTAAETIRAAYAEQMQYHGYKRALISTLLHNPLQDLSADYARVGKLGTPAALFWGDSDRIVPFSLHARVRQSIPHIEFHPVPGAGHTVNYERPDVVNPALIAFLRRPRGDS